MRNTKVLHRHSLGHVPELKVSDRVLSVRFGRDCSISNCRGKCCRLGVDVDVSEREGILKRADLIRRLMDEGQERVSANWFGEEFADPDFPSRRAVSTRLFNGACVFLNKADRCVLQLAESQAPAVGDLKPFFCRAYPLSIEDGVLTIDEVQSPGETGCCGSVQSGPLTVFDICAWELEFTLGADGLGELRRLASEEQEPI